jgi:nondiscriminating glutamyl-tRNA synthetase
LRFLVPEGPAVAWNDSVFGRISFERDQIDDFVMIKADGFPTYNFANVVDDHTMRITHVIRAYEFLSSTPKHLLLYEAFGVEKPVFAHASHILGKDKKKLSKRHAAVSVDEYRKAGYLPEALINFISLLGWTHPEQKDLFDIQELIQAFDIENLHKTGAVFDTDKSLWVNGQYIRKLSTDAFADLALPYLVEAHVLKPTNGDAFENLLRGDTLSKKDIQLILATQQSRTRQLSEIVDLVRFFFAAEIEYESGLLLWKKMDKAELPGILEKAHEAIKTAGDADWGQDTVMAKLQAVVKETGKGVGEVFWPVRVALTGLASSPGPQEVAQALGKDLTLQRLAKAIARAKQL